MNIYKERFLRIVKENIKREGIDKLMESLEKSDFFIAPASTRFHDSEEGGLCKHSVEVFDFLVGECQNRYSLETLAIVALFHDVCKVGYYKVEMRNKKDENGKWVQVPFYTVDDSFPYGHGEKSVFLLQDKLKLSIEECMAIRWHMGLSEPKENYSSMSLAFNKYPLALFLHVADMKSTYLDTE